MLCRLCFLLFLSPFTLQASQHEAVSKALDQIIEMMEELLSEYSYQDKQLNKMHAILIVLEYGYNSLRQQLSGAECSVSELLALSSSSPVSLDDHAESVETVINDITSCIDDSESTLEAIKSTIHPCGEGDWELIVDENYSVEGGDDCPGDWVEVTESGRQFCGGGSVGSPPNFFFCDSAMFTVGREYSKVCGRVVGYGSGTNIAFYPSFIGGNDIEVPYVDGVSLTHGVENSRTHIWTFAMSVTDGITSENGLLCNCYLGLGFDPSPFLAFLGNDIFCESGVSFPVFFPLPPAPHLDDPLWDGRQCREECCSNSPYFVKSLDSVTDEELELRICNHFLLLGGNNLVEKVEIYVQ